MWRGESRERYVVHRAVPRGSGGFLPGFRVRSLFAARHLDAGLVLDAGGAFALWGIHFASGVLFLYAREESRAGPVEVEDYLPWAIGVAYMVRGCVLLVLASVAVGLNFLFGGRRRGEGGGKEGDA